MPHLPHLQLSRTQKLLAISVVSSLFFALEIVIGFRQHSLALVADAFHVASDLISFGVALYAVRKASESERGGGDEKGKGFSFGYQRAELVSLVSRTLWEVSTTIHGAAGCFLQRCLLVRAWCINYAAGVYLSHPRGSPEPRSTCTYAMSDD
jgi:hypothetical protein